MDWGDSNWYILWRDTNAKVDSYTGLVAENSHLDSALDFCRFLVNSGFLKLLKLHEKAGPLPVNASLLEWKVQQLTMEIQRRYKSGDVHPRIELSELQRISHKLDLLAGQVSRVLPVPQVDISVPPLRVIEGGRDE